MGIINKQIGWSNESNLLWNILKQLNRLTSVVSKITGGSSQPAYKVYTALLTQSGTDAPVATVLENTLGSDIVWNYFTIGVYYGENVNFVNPDKVFILFTGNKSQEGNGNVEFVSGEIYNDGTGNKLWFATSNNNVGQDDWGPSIFVEIRIYP